MAFPSYAGSISQLAGNAQAQEVQALQAELTRELQVRQEQERGVDRGLMQQNRLRDDTLRRDEFGLRKQEAEALKKNREDRLAPERDFITANKAEKTKQESEGLFWTLRDGIVKGQIADVGTLQGLEGGKLSSDQWNTLMGELGNSQGRRGAAFASGAKANADELTAQFSELPVSRAPVAFAAPAADPFRKRYVDVTGVAPEADPLFTLDTAKQIINTGSGRFFGDSSAATRTAEAQALAAAQLAAQDARTAGFRRSIGDARKTQPELLRGVIPNADTFTFQPRSAPEVFDAGAFATAPDARSFFSIGSEAPTAVTPAPVAVRVMPSGEYSVSTPQSFVVPRTTQVSPDSIRAQFKAGQITREQAIQQLRAIGFE